jgi:N-acetyl-1-D-myo-inositol-2-amino-2-deoxy-alpha-D-glucopyranoside deacetylase
VSQRGCYDPAVSTLLAIVAHPDDESYSFGGTLALAAKSGWRCVVVCATSGEKGKLDGRAAEPEVVRRAREAEVAASCALLGAEPPLFLKLPDGALPGLDGTPEIATVINGVQPDIILSLGPDGAYGHPDHLAVYRWVTAVWSAMGAARPALLFAAFPKGLFLAQYELCLDMMGDPPNPPAAAIGTDTFDYEVPIAAVAATKRAAIAAHRSQLPGGDPEAIFPPGIVAALMATEPFTDASGAANVETAAALRALSTQE